MKIIINGACGRMGQALRQMLEGENQLAGAVDICGGEGIAASLEEISGGDVIIDFSFHTAIDSVLDYACKEHLPVVICTTGHTEQELEKIRAASQIIPVFHSGNMSLGIAALCDVAKKVAGLFPDADIEIIETHHKHKKDAPSGTALMLAKAIAAARNNAQLVFGRKGIQPRQTGEIGIHAVRRGEIVGIHEIHISTANQTITLKHEAHNRALFAEGALSAAAFLMTQPAGLYDMTDVVG